MSRPIYKKEYYQYDLQYYNDRYTDHEFKMLGFVAYLFHGYVHRNAASERR